MQDGSNEISRDEWIARYGNDDGFRDYDLNGDNHINRNEWIAGRTADAEFREADTDGNMQLDRQEWIARCVGVAGTISHQLPEGRRHNLGANQHPRTIALSPHVFTFAAVYLVSKC